MVVVVVVGGGDGGGWWMVVMVVVGIVEHKTQTPLPTPHTHTHTLTKHQHHITNADLPPQRKLPGRHRRRADGGHLGVARIFRRLLRAPRRPQPLHGRALHPRRLLAGTGGGGGGGGMDGWFGWCVLSFFSGPGWVTFVWFGAYYLKDVWRSGSGVLSSY